MSTSFPTMHSNTLAYPRSIFGRPPQSKCWKPGYTLSFLPRPHYVRVWNAAGRNEAYTTAAEERSEADKLVDNMEFSELCNEFECVSSPSVEATSRQLARDILEMREGNRALGSFALSVKYKDPLRSFIGREKYKRPSWVKGALNEPSVTVQEMEMLSTSILNIKWTVRGKPKFSSLITGGDVIICINSIFTLNQISGQVIEHKEDWDLSSSSSLGQAYFWASRWLYVTVEVGKDAAEAANDLKKLFNKEEESPDIFADPSGDPTKFFQIDNNFQRDIYQVGLFLAVLYLVVQFLRETL
eukprot:Gb_14335 [translate_table: standard]